MTKAKAANARAPLIVWCADADAAAPVLEALRHRFNLDLRDALPKNAESEETDATPEILLLCLSPVETLCRAMARGVIPSLALQEWLDQAGQVIALNRANRRHVRILDIAMALAHPGAFMRQFDLPEGEKLRTLLSQAVAPTGGDGVLRLMAGRVLSDAAHVQALLGEFEAVSLNFSKDGDDSGVNSGADADAVFATYQQVALLQAHNRAAQEEVEALNVRQIKLELPHLLADAQGLAMAQELEMLAQGRRQMRQRLEQLSQGVESYRVQVVALREETDGLKRKAGDKDRALIAAGDALRSLEAQTAHLQEKERRLQKFLSSRSYRLTAPLRRLRTLLSTGRRV